MGRNELSSQMNAVQKEIRAMQKLNSNKNIVNLWGYDLNTKYDGKNAICLVQELAPNGEVKKKRNRKNFPRFLFFELFDYLMYTKKFPEKMARSLFQQLMNGLEACHSQGKNILTGFVDACFGKASHTEIWNRRIYYLTPSLT